MLEYLFANSLRAANALVESSRRNELVSSPKGIPIVLQRYLAAQQSTGMLLISDYNSLTILTCDV